MTRDDVLRHCLAKPGAWIDVPWDGDEVVKVGAKIFAFLGTPGADPPRISVKCGRSAEAAAELRARFPGAVTVAAYVGRFGWNSVTLDGTVPAEEVLEAVDVSYELVLRSLPASQRPR